MNTSDGGHGLESGSDPGRDLFRNNWYMKEFNYGIGVGAGLEYQRLSFYVNYEFGLANLVTDRVRQSTTQTAVSKKFFIKTNNLCISAGYRIY